ncbi:MAG: alkaline phosphatase family protein [Candidatus Saganbacteria bacterium]|nr:alkaline phosphatase family protein [Candidatus Saganbacteria bacterium]
MKKILYVVLDGLGDRPNPELGGKTPLEAAETPNMDTLAKNGMTGIMYPVGKGIAPESDVAVISLLGYDAEKYYTGRGPLESYAVGLEVADGDLAYRVNFATMDENKFLKDRRVGRNLTTAEANELAEEINSKVKLERGTFEFKSTVGHRGVLVIRGKDSKLSAEVSNTDPAYAKHGKLGIALEKFEPYLQECKPLNSSNEAKTAAELTNEFIKKSHQVLNGSETNKKRTRQGKVPGNVILTRDAGDTLPKFPNFNKIFNIKGACFVQMPVERGIALLTGMDVVDIKDGASYKLWTERVLDAVNKFDLLYIHLKGPDEPAHDGNAIKKRDSIADIDRNFFGNLLPNINIKETLICVTADHSTPCILKAHSDDPVPLLISGGSLPSGNVKTFSENTCKTGELGEITGPELMPLLIKYSKS